ncbi:unnamed protein product [Lampetra fluviatilis]
MACYYLVISSPHLSNGHFRNIKGVFRGPLCRGGNREPERGEEQGVTRALEDLKANFYCKLCDKQYYKHREFDNHINSYDHAHKQRLKELKQREFARNVLSRSRREERRRGRALRRVHCLAEIKQLRCIPGSDSAAQCRQPGKETVLQGESRAAGGTQGTGCTDETAEPRALGGKGDSATNDSASGSKGAVQGLRVPDSPLLRSVTRCPAVSAHRVGLSFSFARKVNAKLESSAAVFSEDTEEVVGNRGVRMLANNGRLTSVPGLVKADIKTGSRLNITEDHTFAKSERKKNSVEKCQKETAHLCTEKRQVLSSSTASNIQNTLSVKNITKASSEQIIKIKEHLTDKTKDNILSSGSNSIKQTVDYNNDPARNKNVHRKQAPTESHKAGAPRDLDADQLFPNKNCLLEEASKKIPEMFFPVTNADESATLQWPTELVQFTKTEPSLSFSCNPLSLKSPPEQMRLSQAFDCQQCHPSVMADISIEAHTRQDSKKCELTGLCLETTHGHSLDPEPYVIQDSETNGTTSSAKDHPLWHEGGNLIQNELSDCFWKEKNRSKLENNFKRKFDRKCTLPGESRDKDSGFAKEWWAYKHRNRNTKSMEHYVKSKVSKTESQLEENTQKKVESQNQTAIVCSFHSKESTDNAEINCNNSIREVESKCNDSACRSALGFDDVICQRPNGMMHHSVFSSYSLHNDSPRSMLQGNWRSSYKSVSYSNSSVRCSNNLCGRKHHTSNGNHDANECYGSHFWRSKRNRHCCVTANRTEQKGAATVESLSYVCNSGCQEPSSISHACQCPTQTQLASKVRKNSLCHDHLKNTGVNKKSLFKQHYLHDSKSHSHFGVYKMSEKKSIQVDGPYVENANVPVHVPQINCESQDFIEKESCETIQTKNVDSHNNTNENEKCTISMLKSQFTLMDVSRQNCGQTLSHGADNLDFDMSRKSYLIKNVAEQEMTTGTPQNVSILTTKEVNPDVIVSQRGSVTDAKATVSNKPGICRVTNTLELSPAKNAYIADGTNRAGSCNPCLENEPAQMETIQNAISHNLAMANNSFPCSIAQTNNRVALEAEHSVNGHLYSADTISFTVEETEKCGHLRHEAHLHFQQQLFPRLNITSNTQPQFLKAPCHNPVYYQAPVPQTIAASFSNVNQTLLQHQALIYTAQFPISNGHIHQIQPFVHMQPWGQLHAIPQQNVARISIAPTAMLSPHQAIVATPALHFIPASNTLSQAIFNIHPIGSLCPTIHGLTHDSISMHPLLHPAFVRQDVHHQPHSLLHFGIKRQEMYIRLPAM